mmetsp:Transcript_3409/g.11983  ORF Transcript_3409/g.11983 Transcript_3409/m.11983 type:complete len:251 (+) Transcript_3409:756-1508(+)
MQGHRLAGVVHRRTLDRMDRCAGLPEARLLGSRRSVEAQALVALRSGHRTTFEGTRSPEGSASRASGTRRATLSARGSGTGRATASRTRPARRAAAAARSVGGVGRTQTAAGAATVMRRGTTGGEATGGPGGARPSAANVDPRGSGSGRGQSRAGRGARTQSARRHASSGTACSVNRAVRASCCASATTPTASATASARLPRPCGLLPAADVAPSPPAGAGGRRRAWWSARAQPAAAYPAGTAARQPRAQ